MIKKLTAILLLLGITTTLQAAQTKYVNLQGTSAFSKGDFDHTKIDMQGNLSLGPSVDEIYDTKNLLIQSAIKTEDGVYFSTAKDAGLFFYDKKTGDTKKLYENSQSLSIPSFVLDGKTLYFVESPSNVLYSLDIKNPDEEPQKIKELKIGDYVWQLGLFEKSLYFSTGGKAALYQLPLDSLDKEPVAIFQSPEEGHFATMEILDGFAYLGGMDLGGLYKVDLKSKKVDLLYKTYEGNISDILLGKKGDVFFTTANKEPKPEGKDFDYTDTLLAAQEKYQLIQAKILDESKNSNHKNEVPSSSKDSADFGASVKNSLYHIQKNGAVDKLLTLDNTGLNTLLFGDNEEELFIGTSGGHLFNLDLKSRSLSLLGSLEDEDVSQIENLGDTLLVMTSNIGQLYKMGKTLSETGTFTSDIIDLSSNSQIGRTTLEESYTKEGEMEVFVRGGQTPKVDNNWTDWIGPLLSKKDAPLLGKVHYLQYKVNTKGHNNKTPVLSRILTAYLPDNKIPSISLFSVYYDETSAMAPKQNLQIRWNATDADKDQLIYRVFFRQRGDVSWSLLLESPNQDKTVLDTHVLPNGVYQFKLEVSDELDNSKERAGKDTQLSPFVLVNNTPPTLSIDSVSPKSSFVEIHGLAKSEAALIGKIYYKVGVDSDWVFVIPDSGIYDDKSIPFTIKVPLKDLKNIENSLFIRVFDVNMNQISSRVKLNHLGKQIT